jgi:hypothetical protein
MLCQSTRSGIAQHGIDRWTTGGACVMGGEVALWAVTGSVVLVIAAVIWVFGGGSRG